jgi:hypothetical protein
MRSGRARHRVGAIPLVAFCIGGLLTAAAAGEGDRPGGAPASDVQVDVGPRVDIDPNASLALLAPRPGETLSSTSVLVLFKVEGFPLGEEGRHLHLVLDDGPAIEHDGAPSHLVLRDVAAGTHVLRAFLCHGDHTSAKSDRCFAAVAFHVLSATDRTPFDPAAPLLTWGGPIVGPPGQVVCDYVVTNVALGPGKHKVRILLDGTPYEIGAWLPLRFSGLSPGRHAMAVELLAPDGRPAPGRWNRAEREFDVVATR